MQPGDLAQHRSASGLGDWARAVATLRDLLARASGGEITLPPGTQSAGVALRSLGLDSIAYVALMNAIEECFEVSWTGEEPLSTFATLGTIAEHLVGAAGDHRSRGGQPPQATLLRTGPSAGREQ